MLAGQLPAETEMNQPRDDRATTTYSETAGAPASEPAGGRGPETAPSGSLAEHLERSDRGEADRLSPERYADELATLAGSLADLHERGIVHGNVRPASVSFDPGSGRLRLPPPTLADEGANPPVGDPYVAPEQHRGEYGPSIDQYALAVLAREIFTARASPAPTAPLREALRRGTAPLPDDRYPDIVQFGEALASAVRREAPHGLADRLAAKSDRFRASLAPAGLLASTMLITGIDAATDPLAEPLLMAILAPITAAAIAVVAAAVVGVAAAIRRPGWPSLRLVQPFWVPLAAIGAIFVIGGADVVTNAFQIIVGVYAARALLAAPPESSGRWLIGLLRRWDLRRTLPPARQRAVSAAVYTAILAVLLAPVVAGTLWSTPFEFPSSPAREYAPLVAVANFRGAMGNGETNYACRKLMTAEAAAPARECPDVVGWAGTVLRNDPAIQAGGQVLGMRGALNRYRVQELPTPSAGRFWTILAPGGEEMEAGGMYTVGASARRLVVMISRNPPAPHDLRSQWLYEVVKRQGAWLIDEFRACDVGPPGSGRRDARCLVRDGLPGAQARALLAEVESPAERR